MPDIEFNDEMFKPANPRVPGAGADPEGNLRPAQDLAEVSGHNDKLPVAVPGYGRGPSQDEPNKGAPKPVLDPEPNYNNFQMNPNRASTQEPRVTVQVTETDLQDVPDEMAVIQEGPEVLED